MTVIDHYIDAIFEPFPQTPDLIKLKKNLLLSMTARYEQLKAENKSEQQALGTVLVEFGTIDELIKTINLEPKELKSNGTVLYWSDDEVQEFMNHRSKFGVAIAFGVSLILFAPALVLFIQELALLLPSTLLLDPSKRILLSFIPLVVLIALAIGLFITFGLKEQQFDVGDKVISIHPSTHSYLKQELKEFKPQFTKGIVFGVILCILGLVFLLVPFMLVGITNFWPFIFLLSFISIGLFLFIFFCIIHSTYNKLLSIGSHTPQKVASERLTTNVATIIFPLAASIYVLSGLLFNTWSPGWMIFPILGIGFGLFAIIVENPNLFKHKK